MHTGFERGLAARQVRQATLQRRASRAARAAMAFSCRAYRLGALKRPSSSLRRAPAPTLLPALARRLAAPPALVRLVSRDTRGEAVWR